VARNNSKGGEAAVDASVGGAGMYFNGRGYMDRDVSGLAGEDEGARPRGLKDEEAKQSFYKMPLGAPIIKIFEGKVGSYWLCVSINQ